MTVRELIQSLLELDLEALVLAEGDLGDREVSNLVETYVRPGTISRTFVDCSSKNKHAKKAVYIS